MDRGQPRPAHADHPIAAPLDDDSVRRLLERGVPRADARVLDLGCGGGEWLLRALATHPRSRAECVDISEGALAQARRTARLSGLQERLVLHHGDAAEFAAPDVFDLVITVGATHAFGGLGATLAAARRHLAPGGASSSVTGSGRPCPLPTPLTCPGFHRPADHHGPRHR